MNVVDESKVSSKDAYLVSEAGMRQMEYSAVEKAVLDFDGRVRYCGVLDEMGRTVSGGMRPGVKSLEPDAEAERVDLHFAITRGMTQSGVKYLGKTNFIIIHREHLMFIAFPRPDGKTVLVSTEPDFPLESLKPLAEVVDQNYRT